MFVSAVFTVVTKGERRSLPLPEGTRALHACDKFCKATKVSASQLHASGLRDGRPHVLLVCVCRILATDVVFVKLSRRQGVRPFTSIFSKLKKNK